MVILHVLREAKLMLTNLDGVVRMKSLSTTVSSCAIAFTLAFLPVKSFAENIFKKALVNASKTHSSTKPSNITDDDLGNAWNAGSHPPAWIQIDHINVKPHDQLINIRLIPSQSPSGLTEHVVSYTGSDGVWKNIATVRKVTSDDVPIDIFLDKPIKDIKKLRVETTKSPSWVAWKEIQGFVTKQTEGNATTQPATTVASQPISIETTQPVATHLTCEEARQTACTPSNATAVASVMCMAAREGCGKVADTHRSVTDRTAFRSFCQAQLTDLDRSTFKTSQVLSRYRYNTAPTDSAVDIGKEIGGLYGAAVQIIGGVMSAGIRAGQGDRNACEPEYEAACRRAYEIYESRCK